MDTFQIREITATNVGTTLLKLQFLLEEYPEFHIFLSAEGISEIGKRGLGNVKLLFYFLVEVRNISGKELGRLAEILRQLSGYPE